MVTALFRFLALFLIVAGIMLLGADAISTLEAQGQVRIRTVESIWGLLSSGSLSLVKDLAAGLPDLIGGLLTGLLSAPSWIAVGLMGVVLAYFFRFDPDAEEE